MDRVDRALAVFILSAFLGELGHLSGLGLGHDTELGRIGKWQHETSIVRDSTRIPAGKIFGVRKYVPSRESDAEIAGVSRVEQRLDGH
ncbi:hypothetical protein BDV24DRAFT_38992 [Aspergillus arachidicola]|uniref:Uncharacterized protein n=1 Tax=Aspergillus arachidicola TaxID=656916 RepID=A0A5N6YCE4_9EURO|nr:hypothetical protein BDV24DRAFT_38992 [Aspergillus arachidicola]